MNITIPRKANKIMSLLVALFVTLGFLSFSPNSVQAATLTQALNSTTFSNLAIKSTWYVPTSFNVSATKGTERYWIFWTRTAYYLTIKESYKSNTATIGTTSTLTKSIKKTYYTLSSRNAFINSLRKSKAL